ncbi:ImmA/IrrE family metallo-endopeptidase [Agrobacterium cavarae]|uniref:ImmA/IrrE family metallo-endopeptidase n=1 Tax=Agrobacterium cavarae TaxID=2528239 RepID=UPI0028A58CC9|nr:hypothetical protein [Agrobacterium cavarae]
MLRGGLILAACAMFPSASFGTIGSCLDFNPGVSYLSVKVDPKSISPPFESPVAFALVGIFSEQIAINNLRRKDAFFDRYAIASTKAAVSAALGVGNDASFLFNPLENASENDDIGLTFVPSDESSILSDKRGIIITNGFVNRLSEEAIKTVFGSVEQYKAHLEELSTHDYSEILTANNLPTASPETPVAVGYLLFGKDLKGSDKVVSKVAEFTNEFLSKLLFATAHEIGHIRLRHNESRFADCASFEARELAADKYAADFLANFAFRMEPDEFDKQRFVNFESFFEKYGAYEFSDKSSRGDCSYPTARKREKEVRKAVYRATVKLKQQTYSSADYTTPNPTSVICSNGTRSWRVFFGDQFFVPQDEMRRRSIQESKKIEVE